MYASWAPVVFWVLLVPLLIVMLIVYLRSKRFYRLIYITSVFTYAMTIMYWIDAYKLGRNAIVGLLVASSLLMIIVGWRVHKSTDKKKKKPTGHGGTLAIISLALIGILVGLSAVPYGWTVQTTTAPSLKLDQVVSVYKEGQVEYSKPPVPIYTITVTNTFIPRQYELPNAQACLYNTEKGAGQWANVAWDYEAMRSEFGPNLNTMEVYRGSKTAVLNVNSQPYYETRPVKAPVPADVPQETPEYDKLMIFLSPQTSYDYVECSALKQSDFARAITIPIIK